MIVPCALVLLALVFGATALQLTVPLTSANGCGAYDSKTPSWSLRNANHSIEVTSHVCLPGNVLSHLHDAGVLPEDPLYRFNDLQYRWVAFDNWTYTLHLPLLQALSEHLHALATASNVTRVVLEATGVRVFANVSLAASLGGKLSAPLTTVGSTDSQFLMYRWDVTAAVASVIEGVISNPQPEASLRVELAFTSTVLRAVAANDAYPLEPMPVAPPYLEGLPSRNFVRTEQSSFGWDWGPAFAPVGIDGSLALHVTAVAPADNGDVALTVRQVYPQVVHVPSATPYSVFSVNVTVDAELYSPNASLGVCTASICDVVLALNMSAPTLQWLNDTTVVAAVSAVRRGACGSAGMCWLAVFSAVFFVEQPDLWWPRGYGAQTLHPVSGTVTALGLSGSPTASWHMPPLAIRAIALITAGSPQADLPVPPLQYAPPDVAAPTYVAEHGMYFRVNGVPVFAKGANVIPASALPSPSDKQRLLRDLQSAIDANMNIVRVWGGGYYKADWFYEFCDKSGLMVWQEIMFACAQYPVDAAFLADVESEVAEQVQRISRFGSVILWSANNENDIYDSGNGTQPYHMLYTETVMNTIVRFDRSRPMWPSSPSEGFVSGVDCEGLPNGETIIRNKNATAPGHTPLGDAHYYNYFSCPDFAAYPRTHFASEFGFQSLPWLENLAPISNASEGDWSLNSSFMNHRQHHPDGNDEIAQLVIHNFFPANTSVATIMSLPFPRVIYLSQLQQLLCIEDQASYYRRGRDYPSLRTMGSMYWQLNQNWQAPSWTSLEFGGEWKLLHYAMRRAYADVHLSAFIDPATATIYAHITNDGFAPIQQVVARVFLVRYRDGASVFLQNTSVDCFSFAGGCSASVAEAPQQSGTFVWSNPVTSSLSHNAAAVSLCGESSTACFVWIEVWREEMSGVFSLVAPSRPLFLSGLGAIEWGPGREDPSKAPNIVSATVLSVALNTATVNVSLTAPTVALYVSLRSPLYPLGQFSANLLYLIPCADATGGACPGNSWMTVTFVNHDSPIGSIADFQASLVVEVL